MIVVTWDEYYSKFYDWENSTQINRLSALTDFGNSDEVCEIAVDLCDEAAATRLIKKALAAGVVFAASEIVDMVGVISEDTLNAAILSSKCHFTGEQLDDLYGTVSDEAFEEAVDRSGINYFEEDGNLEVEFDDDVLVSSEPQTKIGFWGTLAISLGIASASEKPRNRSIGSCNGDCAHCPPHYGYRYGRWYYGHHHQHGCEFGGNKGL